MMQLSKLQKSVLGQLARKAWLAMPKEERDRVVGDAGEAMEDPFVSEAAAFAWWRHREQGRACGVTSLRLATQDDFLRLRAWWSNKLEGRAGVAFRDLMKAEEEPKARASWLLEKACVERGLAFPEYPESICRRQYRCALRDANEKQLWRLVFTVRKRRKPVPAEVEG